MFNKSVTFFIRAYNDLDCRIPTILFLANKKKIKVNVFFYPTENGFYNSDNYENISLLKNNNKILVQKFDDFLNNNFFFVCFIKLSYFLKSFFHKIIFFKKNKIFSRILAKFDSFILSYIDFDIVKLEEITRENILIFDDIILDKSRSKLLNIFEKKKIYKKILAIHTGQDTYINLNRDFKNDFVFKKKNEFLVDKFLVPSLNDKKVYEERNVKNKIYTLGNTRFQEDWVNYLNDKSGNIKLKKSNKYKLVLMLSKIEYGIKTESLIETIKFLSKFKDITLIIKPHTRGMDLKHFINLNEYKNVINGEQYDSSTLIKWSSHVLFTGSSIIFQAMILQKKCIFLKNCLSVSSIFDNTNSVYIVSELNKLYETIQLKSIENNKVLNFLKKEVYNDGNSNSANEMIYKIINEN